LGVFPDGEEAPRRSEVWSDKYPWAKSAEERMGDEPFNANMADETRRLVARSSCSNSARPATRQDELVIVKLMASESGDGHCLSRGRGSHSPRALHNQEVSGGSSKLHIKCFIAPKRAILCNLSNVIAPVVKHIYM
jgi:hypothetical protein